MSELPERMTAIEQQRDRLRAALVGLVGAESVRELQEMEVALRMMPAPESDKVAMINAIHALLETAPNNQATESP